MIVRDPTTIIVPTFDKTKHIKEMIRLPTYAKYFTAIDWGGVRDKTVGICYAYDFQRNKVIILGEFMEPANTPTHRIVSSALAMETKIAATQDITARWVDAPGQVQVDLKTMHNFEIRLPIKDDWQAGINNLQLMFARDEIEVHKDCKFLIQSLESGQYNQNRTDFARSDTLGHCDALAACMYAMRMVDRSMPYGLVTRSNNMFIAPSKPEITLSDSLSPKQFGKFRR
jgi:hypothetical protein